MKKTILALIATNGLLFRALAQSSINELSEPPEGDTFIPYKVEFYETASFYILIFATILITMMGLLVWKKSPNINESLKYLCLVVVIIVSLLLMTLGYGASQITPIIGLLGTIAGYLLGRTQNPTQNDTNP